MPLTPEEHKRLYELIQNPPPGSNVEAARQYGVDLTFTLRHLTITPTERAEEMEEALGFVKELRQAAAKPRP